MEVKRRRSRSELPFIKTIMKTKMNNFDFNLKEHYTQFGILTKNADIN